jgi:hypothetical protein
MRTIEIKNAKGSMMAIFPTLADILGLEVGDTVLNTFGKPATVTAIYGRGNDLNGKAYVCFYAKSETGLTLSDSLKEDEVERSVRTSSAFTSAEIDDAERIAQAAAEAISKGRTIGQFLHDLPGSSKMSIAELQTYSNAYVAVRS